MNMLDKLMAEIRRGGTLDTRMLARKLDASPQMVEAMLDHLRQSGFLSAYETCGDGCDGCGLRSSCRPEEKGQRPQLWQYVQPE